MPRSKKKEEVKVAVQPVAQLVGKARKQPTQASSLKPTHSERKGGGGVSAQLGSVNGEMEKNAAAYTASLYDPWRGPARVPDILSYPTAVTATTYTVSAFFDPANEVSSQLYFSPTLNNSGTVRGWSRRNAVVGLPGTYGAWATNNDPNNGTTPALFYRTTSYGVRVRNVGAFLNRGGSIRMGRVTVISQLSATVGDTSRDPRTFAYSLTDAGLETKKMVALPYDYESTLEFLIPADTVEKGGVFFEVTLGDEKVALQFEVWHNYEYIPTVGFSSVVEASTCVGSESSFAAVTTAVERAAGYVGGSISPELGNRITDLAAQYVGGKLYSWFGGPSKGGSAMPNVPAGYFDRASAAYEAARRICRKKGMSDADAEALVTPHAPVVTALASHSVAPAPHTWLPDEMEMPSPRSCVMVRAHDDCAAAPDRSVGRASRAPGAR